MKILLISPGTESEIDNRIIRMIPYLYARAFNAPHAVATIAALTPPGHEVSIHDEHMRGSCEKILQANSYDIIGISVTSNQLSRSLEIAGLCRKHAPFSLIVAGGIGVETLLQYKKADFDVIFSGEAEETWPQFLKDFQNASYKTSYKAVSKPDLSKSPAPSWNLIKEDIRHYNSVLLQTTRGCPFDCSFCDVIYVYGRKPRNKTIEQVLNEVKKLDALGVQMVFVADDNFAGDKKYVKELLRALIPLNNSFRMPLGFFTQLDLGVADDDELLELLADANFYTLMIGVESVSPESLQDLNKKQNMGISITDAINKIQSYGMVVLTHMIIGADSDDASVFDKTAAFINEANIIFHICHPLAAPPGTRLWYDLKRQGRIIRMDKEDTHDQFDILSNIIPKQMSRTELFDGLADYWEKIYEPEIFLKRARGFLQGIKRKPNIKVSARVSVWHLRKMIGRVMWYYMFEAEKVHRKGFFGLMKMGLKDPAFMIPKVIYVYSFFLMDLWRSQYDAKMAREHAQWEREHPECIIQDTGGIPVSEKIREHAKSIVHTAFHHLKSKSQHRETLYQTVLNSVSDFNDRFGSQLTEFDDYYKEQLLASCERVIAQIEIIPEIEEIPEQPYPGFTREIIDALDNRVRNRN